MEIPVKMEDYISESIKCSLGLPVSVDTLRLKLVASQDLRRHLQDQIFALEQRLKDADKRINFYKTEASMNAQGLRRCVEEKEMLAANCSKLEQECAFYEQDLERLMQSCDELAKENAELQARLQDQDSVILLVAEVKSLLNDKESLRINLNRAEEEVKVLSEENRLLDEENKRLLKQLNKERQCHGSENKQQSASSSANGKRKTRMRDSNSMECKCEFNDSDYLRQPLSPLLQNSPDSRRRKK